MWGYQVCLACQLVLRLCFFPFFHGIACRCWHPTIVLHDYVIISYAHLDGRGYGSYFYANIIVVAVRDPTTYIDNILVERYVSC